MKELIAEFNQKIKSKRGETLVETTVSILVFSILMYTVSLIVLSASNMNQYELQKSAAAQVVINRATFEDPESTAVKMDSELTFKSSNIGRDPVTITQKIETITDSGLNWFVPKD